MTRRHREYVLDTQLFIEGFRQPNANEALQAFHRAFAPFEYLSAILAQELRSGVQGARARLALERHVLNVFERANRVVVPSVRAGTNPVMCWQRWLARKAWKWPGCRRRSPLHRFTQLGNAFSKSEWWV